MDAILVVDMQVGLLHGPPKHDLHGVICRINNLTTMVRRRSGRVIWIQHSGLDDEFAPDQPGWRILPDLSQQAGDLLVGKTLNDPFAGTELPAILRDLAPERLLVAGWATDFCVDATVRSAVSNDHRVTAVADTHTLSDRPHLDARTVIRHHNWIWANLIARHAVHVAATAELLSET